jgi:hypothetical protein
MEFNYGKEMTWNPETYQYVAGENGEDWNANGTNKITVINHSDLPIYCEAAASVNQDADGEFKLTVTEGATIEGCEVGDAEDSNFWDMTVTLSGEPHISSGTRVEIGQVSVTIKKVPTTTTGGSTGGSTDGSNGEPTSNAQ